MKKYTMEKCFKIWDDDDGSYYEVAEDEDGGGWCAISYTLKGSTIELPSMRLEAAMMLSDALKEWCRFRKERDEYEKNRDREV